MNWEQLEGKWKQYSGRVREKWGRLTESDLQVIHGRREQLVGKIEERYGIAKEAAEDQVNEFLAALKEEQEQDPHRQDKVHGAGR